MLIQDFLYKPAETKPQKQKWDKGLRQLLKFMWENRFILECQTVYAVVFHSLFPFYNIPMNFPPMFFADEREEEIKSC